MVVFKISLSWFLRRPIGHTLTLQINLHGRVIDDLIMKLGFYSGKISM